MGGYARWSNTRPGDGHYGPPPMDQRIETPLNYPQMVLLPGLSQSPTRHPPGRAPRVISRLKPTPSCGPARFIVWGP